MVAGAAHQSWLAHVMDKVGSILGGDTTLHVTKHPDGSVDVTHDPSTEGEKWGRVAAAALGGASRGLAVGQGPGGPARAAAAGIQTGLQQPQQRLDQANQEASVEQQRIQSHANLVLTQQRSVAQAFQNKMANVAATQAQIDQANAENERFSNAPGAESAGTYGDMDEVSKSPNVAFILQHHPGGTLRTVPIFDKEHNVSGVRAYVIDKAWADQRNDKPVTYLEAKAADTPGGKPTFETKTIPAGAHLNSEIDTILNKQNADNLKVNADYAKAQETAKKEASEEDLRKQQIATGKATASKDYAEAAAAVAKANVLKGGLQAAGAASQGLHGDDYLQASGIDQSAWQQIKATANGDIKIPTATRSPQNQAFRNAVMNYDPTFTDARYTAKQDFKTKGDATSVQGLSTALEHLDNALSHSAQVGFSPSLLTGRTMSGAAADYNQDIKLFTEEAGKLVANKAITQGEYEDLKKDMASPVQSIRDHALRETVNLMGGRVRSLVQKYKTATGQEMNPQEYFDPATQQRVQKYALMNQQPTAAQPTQPTAAQPQQNVVPAGKHSVRVNNQVVGYADDAKGTNYHAF
jgi:hypothetical protein